MNEKRNISIMKINAAQEKPWPVKIVRSRTLPEIKRNSDAFAVDWQLEGPVACSENIISVQRHKISGGLTSGRAQHIISFVPPKLKPNK